MSRQPDRLRHALWQIPVMLLLSLGMGLPMLHGASLTHFIPQYLGIAGGISLACGLFLLRKRLLPLALIACVLSQLALLPFEAGLFHDTLRLISILRLWSSGVDTVLSLYGDILCTQLAVYLTLLCCLISSPDNGLYPPVFCVAIILTMEWMIGLHESSLYMLPVLPGLLLHYAATHRRESTDAEQQPHAVSPVVLPVAVLLSALSLLLAPADGTTMEPFSSLAQKIRDAIDDHFFFTEERARYSLENDGWMPLGQMQLGGIATPSEQPVMLVKTDEVAYLRGAILDTYTGGAWYDSISARRYSWNAAHYRALRSELYQTAYPLLSSQSEKELTVTMLSGSASTLFTPQRIRALTLGDNMVGYFNTGTEVFITRNLLEGDTYSVRYLPMKATDRGMAALAAENAQAEDPAFLQMQQLYTKLPTHLQQEIFDIANHATANATTPFEKAAALRDYLKSHYGYTLDVQSPPESVDFVAWFLLAEQKGYCTYFASAMTVMCRMVGLPARYVEGYVARPDESGTAYVTGLSAHAWTEVYLNGVGWVTFDATASMDEPDRSGNTPPNQTENQSAPTPTPEPAQTPTPEPENETPPTPSPKPESEQSEITPSPKPENTPEPPASDDDSQPSLPWLWLLLLILLLVLLALRIRATHPISRAQRAGNDTQALLILWNAALDCAVCLGCRRSEAETPLQFAQRAENALGTRMLDIAEAVSAVRYGRHPAPEHALNRARDVYQSLEERLSPWHKLRLAFKRAFSLR